MADSLLSTQMKTTPPDNKAAWGRDEAAVEVLAAAAASATPSAASANPGTDATKAIAVQFVTGGKPLIQTPLQYTGVPSSYSILTADGTVFTLAAGEIGFIQNLSADAPLAVKFGASASTSSLNLILKASTAASDGTGGFISIVNWIGVVSVAKMTGTASYLAWKQAP